MRYSKFKIHYLNHFSKHYDLKMEFENKDELDLPVFSWTIGNVTRQISRMLRDSNAR